MNPDFASIFSCCDSRRTGEREVTAESRICGVGINFRADKTGALYVSSLVENGPADKTGKVRPGDVLYEVDGTVGDPLFPRL
mmetsp:Transcript_4679/g.17030  ORF Transcript_4679/g.17030 Transcript_4679/m.17030 type:complete len:82 (-) Transcript_4679:162-407(-)